MPAFLSAPAPAAFAVLAALVSVSAASAPFSHPGCPDLAPGDFRKVSLVDKVVHPALHEPVKMDIAPDGRIFWIERAGALKAWDPATGAVSQIGKVAVRMNATRGGMGITLDPGFPQNGWVYVVYHPDIAPYTRHTLSRFTLAGGVLTDERTVLDIPLMAGTGNHASGAMAWDGEGNLFLALGDAISPDDIGEFKILGYAPVHPGHPNLDARRTSGNTDDLNGKVLRIRPRPEGGYAIPAGNLFPPGDTLARPEVYTMGHRNPWTLHHDKSTGWLLIGDVGTDAYAADPERGPSAQDEFNVAKGPGNFGWPYLGGRNLPYNQYDFANARTGPRFDPARPVNLSPFNTGREVLPPGVGAVLAYGHDGLSPDQARFPLLLGRHKGAPIAGPVYRYDGALASRVKLPPHFDGLWFIGDWERRWFLGANLDATGTDVVSVRAPFPGLSISGFAGGLIGPEGALYLIEYGEAAHGSTSLTKLSRIEYVGDCRPAALARPLRGAAGARPRMEADLAGGRLFWVTPGGRARPVDAAGRSRLP